MVPFSDDFDDFDDFDDDDDDFNERDHSDLPVFKKAEELVKIVQSITEIIETDDDIFMLKEQMMSNAVIIPAKIAGAEGGDIYSIRFDNATLIKLAARELQAQTSLLKVEELCNPKYIELLRREIEEFRILFLDWVRSFDKTNDIEDEWDIKNL
ncbi:MAG: four helix bundle protein [Cytophagaceae bacterium]